MRASIILVQCTTVEIYRLVIFLSMTRDPWIPAPCKAAGRRLPNGGAAGHRRRRSISFAKPVTFHMQKLCGLGSVATLRGENVSEDKEITEAMNLDAAEREINVLNHLRHLRTMYCEEAATIAALKRKVDFLEIELRHARLELNTEKDARRNVEIRCQTLSMGVSEAEGVIDAQKSYIQALRNTENVKQRDLVETLRQPSAYNALDILQPKRVQLQAGIAATVFTAEVGVQTDWIYQEKAVQTKEIVDGYSQTTISGHVNNEESLREQLDSERQLTALLRLQLRDGERNQSTRLESDIATSTKKGPSGSLGNGSNVVFQNGRSVDGAGREKLTEILVALQTLEEQVRALKKQLQLQKVINRVLEQYIQILMISYDELFT